MQRIVEESIRKLYQSNQIIEFDSPKLDAELRKLLNTIDMAEFFNDCSLNPSLNYNEAVVKACRQATMYTLYAIIHKLSSYRSLLEDLRVCDGFVGTTPHTWFIYKNQYYVDLTLAQFTPLEIPYIAVLPVQKATGIYTVNHVFTWNEWVKIEANMSS